MARLTWHGHACFEYQTTRGKILIDPFLSGNPKAHVSLWIPGQERESKG